MFFESWHGLGRVILVGTLAYVALVTVLTSISAGIFLLLASLQAPRGSEAETMPIGTEVILNPGDWLFVDDPQDDARNAGQDDVVLLVSGLTRVGEPFTTLMGDMDMATPTTLEPLSTTTLASCSVADGMRELLL